MQYMPRIQTALCSALSMQYKYDRIRARVSAVRTDAYLSGMQAVMLQGDGGLGPAGPLEIIAAGGLSMGDVERIKNLSVLDAHIASLYETVSDVAKDTVSDGHCWRRVLARECHDLLKDKIVIKRL